MINLDSLYLKDLPVITKKYIISNAPHTDEQFNSLIYLYKVSRGISFLTDDEIKSNSILQYLETKDITLGFFLECINLLTNFNLIVNHPVKISLLRIAYLTHSNITLKDLTKTDVTVFAMLPLNDFKSFLSSTKKATH